LFAEIWRVNAVLLGYYLSKLIWEFFTKLISSSEKLFLLKLWNLTFNFFFIIARFFRRKLVNLPYLAYSKTFSKLAFIADKFLESIHYACIRVEPIISLHGAIIFCRITQFHMFIFCQQIFAIWLFQQTFFRTCKSISIYKEIIRFANEKLINDKLIIRQKFTWNSFLWNYLWAVNLFCWISTLLYVYLVMNFCQILFSIDTMQAERFDIAWVDVLGSTYQPRRLLLDDDFIWSVILTTTYRFQGTALYWASIFVIYR
jgi:hypothetical protein